jgi:hypothetical protein
VCHLEPLLQLAIGCQLQSTQIQALLMHGEVSKYFIIEGSPDQDWQQCVVRLHPQHLIQDAAERESNGAHSSGTVITASQKEELVQAAIHAWSSHLNSDRGRAGLLAALALISASSSSKSAFTMHLRDLCSSIAQLLSTSSDQLATLLPLGASWQIPEAHSLQHMLASGPNCSYFDLSPALNDTHTQSQVVVRLLASQLALQAWQAPSSIASGTSQLRLPSAAAADNMQPLPAFVFEFDSSHQLPKPAAGPKPAAPGSLPHSSSSGMIPAFMPEQATPPGSGRALPAPSTAATSSCSLDHFSDATESIMRNSAFHHPSSWSSSHSGDLFR